jgi:hypothetical protein
LGISLFSKIYMISSCYENNESGTVIAVMTLQGTTIFDRACVSDEFIPKEVRAKKYIEGNSDRMKRLEKSQKRRRSREKTLWHYDTCGNGTGSYRCVGTG